VNPQCFGIVADIAVTVISHIPCRRMSKDGRLDLLDCHQANACQDSHDNPKLPERERA
jgi:hypothetical protein